MSAKQQFQAKPLLCPMGLVGMLQLSLDAALLESTWDFSLRNLLLTDLPASKFTHNQGPLNKNAIKSMDLISCGRQFFSASANLSCFLFCSVFFVKFFLIGFFIFYTLGHLACFGLSLHTFSYRLFSISSSRHLLHFKQTQIYDQELVGLKLLERISCIHYCRCQDVAAMSLSWTDYSKLWTWVLKIGGEKKLLSHILLV